MKIIILAAIIYVLFKYCNLWKILKGKGRNDHEKILRYLTNKGMFLSKFFTIDDDEFDEIVYRFVEENSPIDDALRKLGIDSEMVQEVEPLLLANYRWNKCRLWKRGDDDGLRGDIYEITWIFAGPDEIYTYNKVFDLTGIDNNIVKTDEYFYKDINSITHYEEDEAVGENSHVSQKTYKMAIRTMGSTFVFPMIGSEKIERSIQALKSKIREKKMS